MTLLAFGLGANLGDRLGMLMRASRLLDRHFGTEFIRSPIYETAPHGLIDQPNYLNQVVAADIDGLSYPDILEAIRRVERQCGKRARHNMPRHIDVDALCFGSHQIMCPSLELPHPRLPVRRFVLQPLADLRLAWRHPRLGMTIDEMLDACPDTSEIHQIDAHPH